jgi:hypothetical protein
MTLNFKVLCLDVDMRKPFALMLRWPVYEHRRVDRHSGYTRATFSIPSAESNIPAAKRDFQSTDGASIAERKAGVAS